MEHSALRPYAAVGTALLGAALIGFVPVVAPVVSHINVQSPAVQLTSTADAFLDLANALDPSASTDGLIGVANNLDSFLDLFGNPTVNLVDTLATDFVGFLDVGSSVNSIPALIEGLDSDLNAGFTALDADITGAITTLDTDLATSLSFIDGDLSPLGTIAAELGAGGALNTELGDILTALGPTGELGTLATDVTGVSATLNDLFGNGGEIVTLLGYLTYLPEILDAL
jgi:hypothetical protein